MQNIDKLYKEWLDLQPLSDEIQTRINRKFMLEFNYNSNHIEGNTLTYGQTEFLLMFGKVMDEANMKDLEEMKAHNVGLKMMQEEASVKDKPLTETFIRQLHHTLLREDYTVHRSLPDGTTTSYVVHAGCYKTRPNSVVTVTGEKFEYASPEETPALMTDLVAWYNAAEREATMTPIELASLFHYRYIRIHPFEDGNGRIARLVVNYILCRHNYPMVVVKSRNKDAYLTALNRCDVAVGSIPSDGAHAELEQIRPFVSYMSECMVRALTTCIKAAKGENIEEADDWKKSLKLKFRDKLNKPEITEDILNNILDKEYQLLLDKIHTELSEFYSIFRLVRWIPEVAKFYEDTNCVYVSKIMFEKESVILSSMTIKIQLTIQQFMYKIEVSYTKHQPYPTTFYTKEMSYLDSLSEQDCENIINAIGRQISIFIEQ